MKNYTVAHYHCVARSERETFRGIIQNPTTMGAATITRTALSIRLMRRCLTQFDVLSCNPTQSFRGTRTYANTIIIIIII